MLLSAASVLACAVPGCQDLGAASPATLAAYAFALLLGLAGGAFTGHLRARRSALGPTSKELKPKAQASGAVDGASPVIAAIADSNPDAVVLFTDAGQIRYANASARDLFFEGKEPANQNFLQLLGSAPLPLREALLGASDRLFNIDVDGQRETFHVSRRVFHLGTDSYTLLIVKHLTRAISRREVEVLKRVIRVLSHEVNNSLAPVSSLVHSARKIAESPDPGPKLRRVFDTIEERTRHLATFLEGYANLARLPDPRPRRVEWNGFLGHLAELHPGIKLPEPPDKPGYFDPVQIEQVLINLLKNAAEAGSSAQDIELSVRVDPDGTSELRVRDRGHGFSDEALRSALLPLYTTKESGGGMGLALCREIVEAHGGSIGLGNADDGGSWVSVRLPGLGDDGVGARSRLTLTHG
jgi:signal transduction histidine kinase